MISRKSPNDTDLVKSLAESQTLKQLFFTNPLEEAKCSLSEPFLAAVERITVVGLLRQNMQAK
jgi:hypothetical protein